MYKRQTGDAVLQEVARRLRQSVRGGDMVGRFGGEEFIILLIGKTTQQAEQIAERMRSHVGSSPIKVDGDMIPITMSQGLAEGNAQDSADSIIERADQALYEAKHRGRNCVITAKAPAGD